MPSAPPAPKSMARATIVLAVSAALIATSCDSRPQAPPYGRQPQATGSPFQFRSPIENARQLQQEAASALLWRQNGRLPTGQLELEQWREQNLFQCDEPSRELFERFVRQYNRTFADSADKLERLNLFAVTLQRAILFNKVIQADILDPKNYQNKPEIRNYHFIEATNGPNAAIWFADITDCELGLIKKSVFDIFYHIDSNDFAEAYRVAQLNKDFLPGLLSADGFEQLANILLLRLHDRFRGDAKLNQLFAWPLYLKKLAAFAYNQQQASQPGHRTKMALVAFAYPSYFKDLKYNLAAINRTGDNVRANREHERYFTKLQRQFASLAERNKRLAIFRQRWSLVEQLNGNQVPDELLANRTRHASQLPDWLRVQHKWDASELPIEYNSSAPLSDGWGEPGAARSGRLLQAAGEREDEFGFSNQVANGRAGRHFKLTQFSDLTDLEFVAYLSNDFSLLGQNQDSADYLALNFPVRPLDARLRWELAHELEMRRSLVMATSELADSQAAAAAGRGDSAPPARSGLKLAKQVIDSLISDVGLPIGPASLEGIQDDEFHRVFEKLVRAYQKPYAAGEPNTVASFARLSTVEQQQVSAADLADERLRRFLVFKENYARFRAWMVKEAWQLDEAQLVAMLRLADMSWLEIKLTLFRICCLTPENLQSLSAMNATIQYLGSNYDTLCHQMAPGASLGAPNQPAGQASQQEQKKQEANALELYYYYSVHFNKHHTNQLEFARRFDIFRRNIEALRRHSCVRSLTLYESLRQKNPEMLSTIDVIDARRSHLDDLNLDRFEYFKLPASLDGEPGARLDTDLVAAPPSPSGAYRDNRDYVQLEPSRASIAYKRDYFSSLLNPTPAGQPTTPVARPYAERLVDLLQDANSYAQRYRANRADLVYELVMARYKFCLKNYENIDLHGTELRQQCQANGPLGDGAAKPLVGYHFSSLDDDDSAVSGRLQLAPTGQQQQQQQHRDRCAYYRQGLEPWSAGLIRQYEHSPELIRNARCK